MPLLMSKPLPWRFPLVVAVLFLGGVLGIVPALAQDDDSGEESGVEVEAFPKRDGHDRPTTYPKIKFGKKKGGKADEDPPAAKVNLKTRVYMLDTSDAMAKSITIDGGRETTRLEHMVAQMERSLDALMKRKDPRLRFNIVTYGGVKDFADGGEMQAVTRDSVKRAKDWISELKSSGAAEIYPMLKECFDQEPDSATMIVGALPAWPDDVEEPEREGYKDAGEHLIAKVKEWREDGKATTLDITGVGLSKDEVKYFKRLAEAAGGTYLDA